VVEIICRCGKRLGDYVNACLAGYVIIRRRCRHCGAMNEVRIEPETM